MSGYRKLSRTAAQRKALLRNQVTAFLYNGKLVTTEAKAKEVQKIAEGFIALAVREKDNYSTVTVTASPGLAEGFSPGDVFGHVQLTRQMTVDLRPDVPVVTDVKLAQSFAV